MGIAFGNTEIVKVCFMVVIVNYFLLKVPLHNMIIYVYIYILTSKTGTLLACVVSGPAILIVDQ